MNASERTLSGHRASALVLSTWSFGHVANAAAWPILVGGDGERAVSGGSALDAVVAGATAVENDATVDSVGIGGLPDASGRVSLDACVMTDPGPQTAGAVCFVRGYANVAQIARRMMEKSLYIMLAGSGAEEFARREGFVAHGDDLLTAESRRAYAAWRAGKTAQELAAYTGEAPEMNVEERYRAASGTAGRRVPDPSHDTVCVLARDRGGRIAGACTTSGLGYKLPGRVGDSPIIGHGLYVDQEVGAATATGNGELIMSHCGSFLAVEMIRQGREPMEAIVEVLSRIAGRTGLRERYQVGLMALRAQDGAWASAALRPGFAHCVTSEEPGRAGEHRTEPAQRVMMV